VLLEYKCVVRVLGCQCICVCFRVFVYVGHPLFLRAFVHLEHTRVTCVTCAEGVLDFFLVFFPRVFSS